MMTRYRTHLAVAIFLFQQLSWSFVPIPSRKSWLANTSGLSWSRQVEHINDVSFASTDWSPRPCSDHDEASIVSSPNLQSPREWLEYCEVQDGQEGAYTVMRCDYYPSTNRWIRWGETFHQQRLGQSLQLLWQSISGQQNSFPIDISRAMNATNQVIESLLSEASQSLMEIPRTALPEKDAVTVMITLLWTPTVDGKIKVRGHAFHTGQVSSPGEYEPVPMVVNIAKQKTSPTANNEDHHLPNRYETIPQAKLSSWCRRRVPLEEEFKLSGIGEVILTRENDKDCELLEGLTSNLFVVSRDGTLHTPSEEWVLGGWARQLVLDHAPQCGLSITVGSSLNLSTVAEWKEVFVTSAIKVLTPVAKIVMMHRLEDGSLTTETVWTRQEGTENEIWRGILSKILQNYT